MTAVTSESLAVFVVEVLRAMGLPEEEAEIFGGALVFSELRFHPGHGQGVKKLRRYGERFASGIVVEEGRHLFVSVGLGTSILPVRFRVPPEISIVDLSAGRSAISSPQLRPARDRGVRTR